ncbi:hypothetical protein [Enterobacter cloacae]|nr:hypothetical protein [Enterobacter cloacae]
MKKRFSDEQIICILRLNYLTPAEFAAGWRNGKYEEKPTDITN